MTTGRTGPQVTSSPGGPLATHAGPYFGDFGGRFVPEALIAALPMYLIAVSYAFLGSALPVSGTPDICGPGNG